jgi:hypothetical protein
MSRRTLRDAWLVDVRCSSEIGDACRVLLLTMAAEGMTERGYVSIPRTKLADLLGRHPQRVTERIGEAIKAGYLVRLKAGHRGRNGEDGMTSTYAASFPVDGEKANGGAVTFPTPSESIGNGSAVTRDRLPISLPAGPSRSGKVTGERLANTGAHARAS